MATGFDFAGKVVIVTGVGRAGQIGHAVARGFAVAGAKLVISDRDAVGVALRAKEFAAKGADVRAAAGNLAETDVANWVVEQATQTFGRVDVLVNVAGGFTGVANVADAGPEVLEKELAINTTTMYAVSRAAARVMTAQRSGAIVSFASVAALHAKASMAAYSASKAAVAAITRALALEVREFNVRVNAIAPGTVRTADNQQSMGDAQVQWVEIGDIVNAVMFLASDAAAGITGHILPVSHGEL